MYNTVKRSALLVLPRPGGYNYCATKKTVATFWLQLLFFEIRQLHILPVGVPTSTFCNVELNFCVRYGNRWILYFIVTGMAPLVGLEPTTLRLTAACSTD